MVVKVGARECESIAVVSSSVIPHFHEGWHEYKKGRRIFTISNVYAGNKEGDKKHSEVDAEKRRLIAVLRRAIKNGEIDHLIVSIEHHEDRFPVYLSKELPWDAVTYVMCGCGLYDKNKLINKIGHEHALKITNVACDVSHALVDMIRLFRENGTVAIKMKKTH